MGTLVTLQGPPLRRLILLTCASEQMGRCSIPQTDGASDMMTEVCSGTMLHIVALQARGAVLVAETPADIVLQPECLPQHGP